MSLRTFTLDEVAKHKSATDAWIVVRGHVYDVTNFIAVHPGGRKILLKHIGTDATKEWMKFHNPQILETVGKKYLIGAVGDVSSAAATSATATGSDAGKTAAELYPLPSDDDLQGSFGDLIPYADPSWYQDFHSPYYKDSHRKVRAFMRQFVEKEMMPYCHEWDEAKKLPRDLFLKAGKAGILQAVAGPLCPEYFVAPLPAGIPAEEWDVFHEFIVCDELCRTGSGGAVWGLIGGLGIGMPPVIMFGSDFLKQKVLPGCYSGEKNMCLCVTEPHAGSDVANIKTEARLTPDGKYYILNGEKKWITNGAFADYFSVACRTGGEGMGGISMLLVERTMPGVTTRQMQCSGMWASGTGYITFEDVKVPVENLIGQENKGFKYIMKNFNHERMGIVIQATRFARVCFEEAIKHANRRRTFGKKLIQHDVIRNKLAQMAHRIETVHSWMESLMYQSMHMSEQEQMLRLGGPIALCKAASTQMFEYVAREAAQIFGGLAYTRGGQAEKVERLYREVRAYAIPGGSEEIMLDLGMRQSFKVAQILGAKL
ncbi:acyl-CoA dehydrogenase/oxidase [Catenaria anguillulae PL171]|uniref:Acyl-CoA dehydrogenase/oxidase n=1 Tax=Catenaria anguillulae PL171 TaxID=765915 RepID=A0A1Y2I228_9FUNG|nr:acyl-CoA dehydrogenase/oxidase [Catenaria anguillulae PL171]